MGCKMSRKNFLKGREFILSRILLHCLKNLFARIKYIGKTLFEQGLS